MPAPALDGAVGPIDMWGFSESQETSSVSPEMFEEDLIGWAKIVRQAIDRVYG